MGAKHSRHNSIASEPLSKETIEELCHDTGFTEEELLNWHTNFYRDCPDGKLTLKQFEHEYSKIMGKPTQKTLDYVKHMFNVYDQDKNQFIDFKEFIMALSAASVVNRLRLVETLFSVFDLDNDGIITKDEMGKMLHTLVDVIDSNKKRRRQHQHHHRYTNGDPPHKQINLEKRIDDAFNELNTNDDDHITKDEFIEWYMKSGLLSDMKSNGISVHDTSRIEQLGKKSRKTKKQQVNVDANKDEARSHPQLLRYMSHMIEQKPAPPVDEDDDEGIHDDDDDHSTLRTRAHSDDTDSHYSKENERWQHLFNSVLGQIRAQRSNDEEQQQQQPLQEIDLHDQNRISHFNSWIKHGEEKLKIEYYKQQQSNECSPSSDVITIRL